MLSNLVGYISIREKNNERKKFESTDCSCLAKLKIGTVKTSKPQLQLKDSRLTRQLINILKANRVRN